MQKSDRINRLGQFGSMATRVIRSEGTGANLIAAAQPVVRAKPALMKSTSSQTRFGDKPEIDPYAVIVLDEDNPAMVNSATLYPSTVVEVTRDEPDRILGGAGGKSRTAWRIEEGRECQNQTRNSKNQ